MVVISDEFRSLIKLQIKGFLMVAYGSGLQRLDNYIPDAQVDELYDSIEEILEKEGA